MKSLLSDHSVFTYGSFGMWGSLLAGGDVIVSKGRNDPTITESTTTEEDEIFLNAAMPNWLYIDISIILVLSAEIWFCISIVKGNCESDESTFSTSLFFKSIPCESNQI